MRIAIIEDESLVAMGIQGMLEENKHEVVAMATRGATAAELILQHKPDVVLLDINLKGDGLDGIDVCRLAIEMTKAKVVIITAYSDPETRQKALAAGADEIMIKPINENSLLSVLRSLESELRS
ncbi:MAG: response regulator [Gammaproteobacteria bacterium]|nr:response regulator [Gammaproteobacteria bacterium]